MNLSLNTDAVNEEHESKKSMNMNMSLFRQDAFSPTQRHSTSKSKLLYNHLTFGHQSIQTLQAKQATQQNSSSKCSYTIGHKQFNYDYEVKLMFLGDEGVGKTSLMKVYDDTATAWQSLDQVINTTGIELCIKPIHLKNQYGQHAIQLQIHDCGGDVISGNELPVNYLPHIQGIFICFSVRNKISFDNVDKWIELVNEYGIKDVPKIILGECE